MIDITKFDGHTAGPWRASPCLSYVVLGGGRFSRNGMAASVCRLSENSSIKVSEYLPNSELIAAAPDLLAEVIRLRTALYSIDRQLGHDDVDDALRDEITAALEGGEA